MASKWRLTTDSPKVSGDYLVIVKHCIGNTHEYAIPKPMGYSVRFDGWNCDDKDGGDKFRIKDKRDSIDEFDYIIYAWLDAEKPTKEELDSLEVDA